MVSANAPLGVQDPKKTCNLESYLAWSARLRLLVANEILQVTFETTKLFINFNFIFFFLHSVPIQMIETKSWSFGVVWHSIAC
jgi:hypothetical protein